MVTVFACNKSRCIGKEKVMDLAQMILDELAADMEFMGPGRRNDDTVNLLICCRILGKNPNEFVESFTGDVISVRYNEYKKNKLRIVPYLDEWCPKGEEWTGFNYIIESTPVFNVYDKYFGKEN